MKVQIAASLIFALFMTTAAAAQQPQQGGYYMPVNYVDNGGCAAAPVQGYDMAYSTGCDGGCNSGCGGMDTGCGNPRRYLSAFGGWTKINDASIDLSLTDQFNQTQNAELELEADNGWCVGGSIGRQLGQRFRTDMEFAYRSNPLESASILTAGAAPLTAALDGKLNLYSGMANLFFDFKDCSNCGLTPYIGAGAGFAFVDANIQPVGVPATIDLQTSSFAYQFIAGAAMPVSQRASLFAEYRYFGIGDFSLNIAAQGLGALSADGSINSHNVFAGLRIYIR